MSVKKRLICTEILTISVKWSWVPRQRFSLLKIIPVLGSPSESFPQNRGKVTPQFEIFLGSFRGLQKCVLECPDHFDVAVKTTPKNFKSGVTSPLLLGKGSPKKGLFFTVFKDVDH